MMCWNCSTHIAQRTAHSRAPSTWKMLGLPGRQQLVQRQNVSVLHRIIGDALIGDCGQIELTSRLLLDELAGLAHMRERTQPQRSRP